ncbi:MAG: prephenate dehydrogenase [Myxococcaceae bacterium]
MTSPVGIAGLGLIGGSLGLALRSRGIHVTGYDVDDATVRTALARGAISSGGTQPDVLRDARLVVLAAPLGHLVELAQLVAPHLPSECVVVDVGSVKGAVVPELERVLLPRLRYVGGHPMFGAETRGIDAARAALVDGAPFIVTPTQRTDPGAVEVVEAFARELGMRPLGMSVQAHDRDVAAVSHLTYLVGAALLRSAPNLDVAGPGFRDATRSASAPDAMWLEVLRLNAEPLRDAARRLVDELEFLMSLEGEPLHRALSEARARRAERFPATEF